MEIIVSMVVAALVIIIIAVLIREHNIKLKKHLDIRNKIVLLNGFREDLIINHTLEHTFSIHKQLGQLGLAWNKAICADPYGMFRTEDIATMDNTEVYLGNIDGIWTKPLLYWLTYDGTDVVNTITRQYYTQVLSGVDAEIAELEKCLLFHDRRIGK